MSLCELFNTVVLADQDGRQHHNKDKGSSHLDTSRLQQLEFCREYRGCLKEPGKNFTRIRKWSARIRQSEIQYLSQEIVWSDPRLTKAFLNRQVFPYQEVPPSRSRRNCVRTEEPREQWPYQ